MVMAFTIVSAVQEKMQELLEKLVKDRQDAKEERIRKAEEAEQVKMKYMYLIIILWLCIYFKIPLSFMIN